jgi:hypothetical protein
MPQFFWKTYYDTYAASTCLQVKFWKRAGQRLKSWSKDPLRRGKGKGKGEEGEDGDAEVKDGDGDEELGGQVPANGEQKVGASTCESDRRNWGGSVSLSSKHQPQPVYAMPLASTLLCTADVVLIALLCQYESVASYRPRQSPNSTTPVRFPGCSSQQQPSSSSVSGPGKPPAVGTSHGTGGGIGRKPLPVALEFDSVRVLACSGC